ncbi:MAG: hypothetical protein GY801_19765 [bacterium]|nr:hypothetical protein [bacterium]
MRRTYRFMIVGILSVVLSASAVFAGREDFSSEKLRAALKDRLKDAEQDLDRAKDTLEKRSEDFLELIDKEVDEGFVKLDVFRKDLDRKVEGLKQDLGEVLDEEKLAELKDFFENLDENVIASIEDKLIAQLEERLGVTSEQVEQLTPILREALKKRGKLLERYFSKKPLNIEGYEEENETLWQEFLVRMKEVLSEEQVRELDVWRDEQQKKIRQAFEDNEAEESN